MKTLTFSMLACLAVTSVWAQSSSETVYVPGGGWGYYDNRASTPAEGYMRGLSDVIRSQGQQNLANSQAAINYSAARKNEIENREAWTDAYFSMRQKNRAYRAQERGPRATREDWVRYAQAGKPDRLSPSELDTVSGQIDWPVLLRDEKFENDREIIQSAFERRAAAGSLDRDGLLAVNQATSAMQGELKENIRKLPPEQYVQSKNFLDSIAYEATRPAD